MIDKAKELLIKHEGLKLKPYRCSVGKLTIGVGRNIEDNGITEEEALFMLENDIKRCEKELREIFSNFDDFSENRKVTLINMLFNLGKTRFMKFKKMIAAIKDGDWDRAAKEAQDSKWCKQVGDRCKDIVELMKNMS